MIIILVGPDGAGKTTLAKHLAEQFNLEYIKRDKPETEEDRLDMLKSYMDVVKTRDNFIYDRYIYCEKVYGPIMRDASVVSWSDVYALELELKKKNAFIIHCTDSIDALWSRCNVRGEDYITNRSTLNDIRMAYHKVLQQSILPVFEYYVDISKYND